VYDSDDEAFHAAEGFLHAIGRSGGACDCGDVEDTPSSLPGTTVGWPLPCRYRRLLFDVEVEPVDRRPAPANTSPSNPHQGDPTMRVMVLVKANKDTEAGVMPVARQQ
jgi:hypothetical protein